MYIPAVILMVISFVVECAIICCKSCSRSVPTNYIMLLIFTLCQSFVFAFITVHYTA